jgi:hypothetical protein
MRIDQVLLPDGQHARHAPVVTGAPDDRVPVGVQQEHPAAGTQHPVDLGERARDVLDVLEHLRRDGGVEGRLGKGKLVRTRLAQLDPGAARLAGTRLGERQHALADVGPADQTVGADRGRDLGRQQPWAGADVDHVLARAQRERPQHHPALLDHVRRQVGLLDLPRGLGVELHHAAQLPLLSCQSPMPMALSGRSSRRPSRSRRR